MKSGGAMVPPAPTGATPTLYVIIAAPQYTSLQGPCVLLDLHFFTVCLDFNITT
jgi:hypothetical protein